MSAHQQEEKRDSGHYRKFAPVPRTPARIANRLRAGGWEPSSCGINWTDPEAGTEHNYQVADLVERTGRPTLDLATIAEARRRVIANQPPATTREAHAQARRVLAAGRDNGGSES